MDSEATVAQTVEETIKRLIDDRLSAIEKQSKSHSEEMKDMDARLKAMKKPIDTAHKVWEEKEAKEIARQEEIERKKLAEKQKKEEVEKKKEQEKAEKAKKEEEKKKALEEKEKKVKEQKEKEGHHPVSDKKVANSNKANPKNTCSCQERAQRYSNITSQTWNKKDPGHSQKSTNVGRT